MVKVKLTMPRTGPGGSVGAGEVVDLPSAEAEALVASGKAEKAERTKRTATSGPKETR